MRIFIWESLDNMSNNYHTGGGLVVVADSLFRARELIKGFKKDYSLVPEDTDALTTEPTASYMLAEIDPGERVFMFPDSGCC